MKKLFLTAPILLLFISSYAQYTDTVYIDPNYTETSNGSITNPYKSLGYFINGVNSSDISSNTLYLIKRGAKDILNQRIFVNSKANIGFGSYGTGEKPIIHTTKEWSNIFYFTGSNNISINNLIFEGDTINYHAYSPGTGGGIPVVGDSIGHSRAGTHIRFYGCKYVVVDSCILRQGGSPDGTPLLSAGGTPVSRYVTVKNCELYRSESQGVGANCYEFTLDSCHIYNTNMQYDFNHSQWYSAGAPIWIAGDSIFNWRIAHSILDKSTTGNKFCFITTAGGGTHTALPEERIGVFEYNTVITPMTTSEGGAGVYLGTGWGSTIRFNTFTGEQTGLTIRTRNTSVYGNIFNNFNSGKAAVDDANDYTYFYYNNVFYNCDIALWIKHADIKNNIFQYCNSSIQTNGTNNWNSDYNCYYNSSIEEDTHYITDYPEFIDTATYNFHLQSTSPCIDAGTDVGLTEDADGTLLPQGNGFDIGVYEYIEQTGGGDEIYIDPTNSGDPGQNGSYMHPFDNWEDIPWSDTSQINNKSVLQKRGTVCETSSTYTVTNATGVTIGAYGDGEPPVLYSTNTGNHIIDFVWSKDCKVENLIVRGDTTTNGVALSTSAIRVYGYPYQNSSLSNNIQIENCTFENAEFGIRLVNGADVTITNCEINKIEEDGIYASDVSDLEISYCNIHDVNLKWYHVGQSQTESPGDGIELVDDCNNYNIHHNTIDRSNSGNKYCFSYSALTPNSISGVFDHNQCITPLSAGDGGAAIYIGQGNGQEICYNTIAGEQPAVISMSENLNIYYNIFKHLPTGILSLTSTTPLVAENNVFHDVRTHIQGGNLSVKNNIFNFTETGDVAINLTSPSTLDESNNLYSSGSGGNNSVIGDPMFVNPATGDFHLQNGSPCYDAGLDVGLAVDMDSIPVPQGIVPEIGTYELLQTNTAPQIDDQSFAVAENSINGTQVGTVTATDPDAGQSLTFSITSGNTSNAFAINQTTGVLTVSNSAVLDYETNPAFSLTVQVQDDGAGNLTDEATITVNLTDENESPVIQNQGFSIAENSTNGTQVGTVTATDPDAGQSLTFFITSGNTSNAFAINQTTGVLTVSNSAVLDFETNPSFSLTVQVQDDGAGNLTDDATITVNLTDVNESPVIQNQSYSLAENSNNGTQVGTVTAIDPDAGQTLTFSILSGNTSNAFSINSTTGELTVANSAAIDYESNPVFSLTVEAQDDGAGNLTDDATITVNLTDENESPVIQNQSYSLAENSNNGTQVGTVTATDPDAGQSLTFSILSGNTSNAFSINSTTGELTVANSAAIDYESNPVFNLTVQVQDNGQGSLTNQATVTVNITDQNESPVINNQSFTIEETIGTGELVGVVQATDPDNGQTLTFSITSGNIDNAFAIDPLTGELTVADSTVLDFAVNPVYYLNIEVQDNGAGNLTDDATITVSLSDVNQVPQILAQSFTIEENATNGELVGTVTATDPDAGQTLTYSIINGNTNDAFAIDSQSGELTVSNSTMLDYETTPIFILTVEVQDDGVGNLTAQAAITVNLTDVNETPDIQNQNFAIVENSANGTSVGTVTATDPDAGQSLTYSITFGNTGSAFEIDSQSGELTVSNSAMLDYETLQIFSLTIEVQDNGTGNLTDNAMITVNITDQNESPVIEDQSFTIEETIGTGDLVGLIEATDPDAGQTLTFSITSGNIDNVFGINAVTGELTIADSTVINIIINPVYYLTVEVQDNGPGNLTDDATITVALTDINQTPEIEAQEFTVAENTGNGELVGTVIATDPDVWQTLTYSIENGNTDNAFAIDEITGELTVANSPVLDYETTPTFILIVQVQDNGPGNLTAQAAITIALTDVNEVPEIGDYTFDIEEFSEEGTAVGTVEAVDPDNGQAITYSITSGNTDEAFQIDTITGTITVLNSEALDYTINPQFTLTVKAEDNGQGNLFAESTVTIDVLQITNIMNPGGQTAIAMSLYPNPATNNINIEINNIEGDELTIRIFSVRGEEMLEKEYNNCHSDFIGKLRISEYPKGVYILYIINEKTVLQRKFVKL